MATRATYYFDGLSFANAISLYTDQALNTLAADGYYSLGTIARRQVNGILQAAANCPTCGDALSLCYDSTSASEVCCVGCGTTLTAFSATIGVLTGYVETLTIHRHIIITDPELYLRLES